VRTLAPGRTSPWSVLGPLAILAVGGYQMAIDPFRNADIEDDAHLLAAFAVAAVAPLVVAILLSKLTTAYDSTLVATAAVLTSLGMVLQIAFATESSVDGAFYSSIATRHGFFIGAGFAAMFAGVLSVRHIERLTSYPYTTLLAGLSMIGATVVFGDTVNGARLWLQAGPVRFQPSEVARLLLTLFLASYLYDRRHLIGSAWRVGAIDLPPAPYLLPLIGAVLSAVLVLFLQSDLGMAALIVLGAFALVTSALRSRLATTVAASLIGVSALAAFLTVPRFQGRVEGWLDPWTRPFAGGFQFIQADFALATGRLVGIGVTSPATRVPEVHTDFVLIGIASEFGVLVAAAVLALNGALVVRCAMNALRAGDGFASLLAVALTTLMGLQTLLIAGGTLRLLPLTGVTFPLVSYGGTSMIVSLFSLGVIVGVGATRERRT
jgi:cell division protein FtsW (lipid II flippase)